MFARFTKTFAGTALAAGVLGLAAVVTAGTASAGSIDNKFLDQLDADGIVYPNPQAAISLAHDVCDALDDGASSDEVISAVGKETGLDPETSEIFAVDAANAYCPEYVEN
jgi:hypothetical protein